MFLDPYIGGSADTPSISAAQGSAFAKDVAGDYNPIHDIDNPRFCVPGDLLFALVLTRFGISNRMRLGFTGMVGADVPLRLEAADARLRVVDGAGKTCLSVERNGDVTTDLALVEALVRRYVAFSGHNFPHFLVPLMQRHGVMMNTQRPLVIYECMSFSLSRLDLAPDAIELTDSTLEVAGRRGDAHLYFDLSAGGTTIGQGSKKLVLSGLRPLDQAALDDLVSRYDGWAKAHRQGRSNAPG
jgi:hypothetical protein